MKQHVRFCSATDGVRLAYAVHGSGPPLVRVATWLSHLELDWESPVWRHWLKGLGERHTVVRYDERGCGLSDTEIGDPSVDVWSAISKRWSMRWASSASRCSASPSDALASASVPVLVTHGQGDAIVLPSMAEHTLTVCPAATASWYDGVGHMPFWEAADRFDRELAELAQAARSRRPVRLSSGR